MKIKKTHVPIILASILLAILVLTLIYVIFFMKDSSRSDLYKKSKGDYTVDTNIGIYDENSNVAPNSSLKDLRVATAKIKNNVNNDFITKNIELSDFSLLDYKDSWILYSNEFAETPWIAKVDKNGKTDWILDLSNKKYKNLQIVTAGISKDDIYVLLLDNKTLIGEKISIKGKVDTTKEIDKNLEYSRLNGVFTEDGFVYYLSKSAFLYFYKVDLDFKKDDKTINFFDTTSNYIHGTIYPYIINYYDNSVYVYMVYQPKTGDKKHLLFILNKNDNTTSFVELNNKVTLDNNAKFINEGKLYSAFNDKIFIYDIKTENVEELDYTGLKSLDEIKDEDIDYTYSQELIGTDISFSNGYMIVCKYNDDIVLYDYYKGNKLVRRITMDTKMYKAQKVVIQDNNNWKYIYAENYSLIVDNVEMEG